MMDYEIFKAVVEEKFLSYLPEEYRNVVMKIDSVKRVNCTLDALLVRGNHSQMFPIVYIDDMYEHYLEIGDLEKVIQGAAEKYVEAVRQVENYTPSLSIEHLKDNVTMCLINTEQNREMLREVPNRAFHDLSVIYRWIVASTSDRMGSTIVSNEMAQMAGMTEEELFQYACQNTRNINPVKIVPIQEFLDGEEEMQNEFFQIMNPKATVWVITNDNMINGAVSMLYEENLHELAEKMGDNFIILPSSIHEVIAIPDEMVEGRLEQMLEMVYTINMYAVCPEERLSYSVYHYDKDIRKVTLAAQLPDRKLNGGSLDLSLIEENEKSR